MILGTAAGTGQGGISTALPSYFEALKRAKIDYEFVATHEAGTALHKFRLYFGALNSVTQLILQAKKNKQTPILYVHIGPWFSMLRKLSLVWLGRLMGAKIICQVHSQSLDSYLKHVLGRLACKFYFAQMDCVLVLTEWWRARLSGAGITRLSIVPNPLSEYFEHMAKQSRVYTAPLAAVNPMRLLTMTRLVPGKGVELAIHSLALLPAHYQLTIAGAGPLHNDLMKQVAALNLSERVSFLGWVEGADRLTLYENHDIFLLPTQNDSFGMGFIEAMAFGLPVVALNWGAIVDVVAKDKAGFLVKQPDATLLAAALIKLESVELRREMGAFGQHWVLEQFSIDSIAIKLGNIVDNLLVETRE